MEPDLFHTCSNFLGRFLLPFKAKNERFRKIKVISRSNPPKEVVCYWGWTFTPRRTVELERKPSSTEKEVKKPNESWTTQNRP